MLRLWLPPDPFNCHTGEEWRTLSDSKKTLKPLKLLVEAADSDFGGGAVHCKVLERCPERNRALADAWIGVERLLLGRCNMLAFRGEAIGPGVMFYIFSLRKVPLWN
jgi:hypothetical protein